MNRCHHSRVRLLGFVALTASAPLVGCEDGGPAALEPAPAPEPPAFDPFAGGTVSSGLVCGDDGLQRRLVFTAEPAGCDRHAEIATGAASQGAAWLTIPEVATATSFVRVAEVCLEGECSARRLRIELDEIEPRLTGRWSFTSGDARVGGPLFVERCDYLARLPRERIDLRRDLEVQEVALYQGVKRPLVGWEVERAPDVPVIAGRPALMRIFSEPQPALVGRTLEGTLEWRASDGSPARAFSSPATILGESRDDRLASTLNFEIPAEAMANVVEWSAEIRLGPTCPPPDAPIAPLRIPATGTHRLEAQTVGRLHVTLVPMRYLPGGGRLPDTSPGALQRFRRALLAMFPIEDVVLEVREPVDWPHPITGDIRGWYELLAEVIAIRARDAPPPQTYYYGLIQPSVGFGEVLAAGGVAPVPSPSDVALRVGVGLGWTLAFIHELGHAMGRLHAPCGDPDFLDPDFPVGNIGASIGSWGFDPFTRRFQSPFVRKDFMSYCMPVWVSDYTFSRLAERLAFVNAAPRVVGVVRERVRLVTWGPEGPVVTAPVDLEMPRGRPVLVHYFDAGLEPLGRAEGVELELDHGDGPIYIVPEPAPGAASVRIDSGPHIPWPRPEAR